MDSKVIKDITHLKEILKYELYKPTFKDIINNLYQKGYMNYYVDYDILSDFIISEIGIEEFAKRVTISNLLQIQDIERFLKLLAPYYKSVVDKNYWDWEKSLQRSNLLIKLLSYHYDIDMTYIVSVLSVPAVINTIVKNEELSINQLVTKSIEKYFNFAINPRNQVVISLNSLNKTCTQYLDVSLLSNQTHFLSWLLLKHRQILNEEQRMQLIHKLKKCLTRKNSNLRYLPINQLREDEYEELKTVLFTKQLIEEVEDNCNF